MKVSPIAGGGNAVPGQSLGDVTSQRTSPDRVAAAKAIAAGNQPIRVEQSDNYVDPQVERAKTSIRKIKMRTNQTTERMDYPEGQEVVQEQSAISGESEQTPAVTEETKPLSPQFAALAKQRRALQQERAAFEQQKVQNSTSANEGGSDIVARLKKEPLSVLQEAGVTYDQLTEAILADQNGNSEISQLRAEIKALKEGVDKMPSTFEDQQKQAALNEMRREADGLVKVGDAYEMIRVTNSTPKVIELIDRTYTQTGEVLDVSEALSLVEEMLINDQLKLSNTKKITSRLTSTQSSQVQTQQQQPRQIRTLTNRDGARPTMDKRTRAIMAMNGTLKK